MSIIESVHIFWLKKKLKLLLITPNIMVYGDTLADTSCELILFFDVLNTGWGY